ncbi:WD repeat-containing protein 49-like [Polypterus senegalus]|uniref:WD repeat-containing protein 49-like n=1 Tax=Polypterus senegalus TaxID=55291 RepID=UPI0019640D60|nr:WD repeat-containing protein 49-like [Polypterus senegalus]
MGCVTGTKNITQRLKEMTDGSSVKSRNVPLGSAPPRRLGTDEAVFQAHKGVKAFDFSKEKNLLVTGGLDRILRLWNPYITGWPTGLLHGHNAPISFVHLSSDDDRIYSLSTDINIMVWSIESQACLASIISTASHIKGELSAFHFSHDLGALCIATDTLAVLRFRHKEAKCNSSTSHKLPIICCRYNAQSQHVISCSEDSVVKVWDFNTGALLFEFNAAHNTAAVSCMTLDSSGKRILTGGRDGCVRKWDCSTHQCIALFSPVKDSPEEVTCCIQAEIHSNKYIISAGCDRRINIYPDLQDNSKGVQSLASQWLHQEPSPHYEDIVCIALWPPNLLATSSCGGEVLIWNLISGKVFCRLGSLPQSPLHDASGEDQNVGKILFIPSRGASHKTAASLIASGPGGCIHFWNMFGGGRLFARFRTPSISTTITDLALGKDDSLLLASDQLGFVHVWDIAQFAQQNVETTAPPLLHSWKAHPVSITSVEFVPEQLLILTSSRDCLLRLWTCKGTLIGTFGVSNPWDVKEQSTWKQDLPTELKSGTEDHLPDMQPAYGLGSEVTGSYADFSDTDTNQQLLVSYSSDLNIAEEVQKYQSFPRVHRNQLKQITIPHVCGRMMTYHSLSCYELADVRRTIQKPNPAAELNDPYDFSF